MKLDRELAKKAGKGAGLAVLGAGVGALGYQATDDSPTKDKVQNLNDKVEDLEERPTQEELDDRVADLKEDTVAREEYVELKSQVEQRFTQEEVDELVAEAKDREGLVDYLPVLVNEEVELRSGDVQPAHDVDAVDHNLEDHVQVADSADYDGDDLDAEEYDEVRAVYRHDDGHRYEVLVREFEDGDDADEYAEETRQAVDFADYGDDIKKDAALIRDGNTVVYLYGHAEVDEYDTYRFDAVRGQY